MQLYCRCVEVMFTSGIIRKRGVVINEKLRIQIRVVFSSFDLFVVFHHRGAYFREILFVG